jgi:dihydroorotase
MVLFNPKAQYTVNKSNILYKCGCSPLEGSTFKGRIEQTFVNGVSVYTKGKLTGQLGGMALGFS